MKILVTGGAGFLGTNLCVSLLKDGHAVICMDNFTSGRESNIAHLSDEYEFQLIRADVTEPYFFQVDRIYNLASPASPPKYQSDPIKTTMTNFLGTYNAITCALQAGARLLQASTSEVYGDPEVHPQVEEYRGNVNPIGPRACYDEGKRVAESLIFDSVRTSSLDARVVRIFNTYGPFMDPDDGRIVSNLIVQALLGKSLTVYGDGSQTRSFCFVDDLVRGLRAVMEAPIETGPYNLGNPSEFSILEAAQLIEKLVGPIAGSESSIIFEPLPIDDPRRRCPDISRVNRYTGWKPETDFRSGLNATIEYFRKRVNVN